MNGEAKAQLDRVRYLTLLDEKPLNDRVVEHERIVAAISAGRQGAAGAAMKVDLAGVSAALPRLAAQWPALFRKR